MRSGSKGIVRILMTAQFLEECEKWVCFKLFLSLIAISDAMLN